MAKGREFLYQSSCYCTVTLPAGITYALDKVQGILKSCRIWILQGTDHRLLEISFSGSFRIPSLIHLWLFHPSSLSSESILEVSTYLSYSTLTFPSHTFKKNTTENMKAISGYRVIMWKVPLSPFTQLYYFSLNSLHILNVYPTLQVKLNYLPAVW